MKHICIILFLFHGCCQAQDLYELIDKYQELENIKSDNNLVAWSNTSIAGFKNQNLQYARILEELQSIPDEKLSTEDKINKDLLTYILDDKIYNLEYQSYLFPLSAEGGFLTEIIYGMQYARLNAKEPQENYLSKLKAIPDFINGNIDLLKQGILENKMMPKVVVNNCLGMVRAYLSEPLENHFLFSTVASQLEDETYKNIVKTLIENEIYPSYVELEKFLSNEYLSAAPEITGASQMKDGDKFYEQRIKYFTTIDITPNEVFAIGESEVARIKSEMLSIISNLNFDGDYADFLEYLRTDPKFYPESAEALIQYASFLSKKIERQLPKLFGKMPRMPFTVLPVPAAIAENYTTGRYSPGSYKTQKAGEYWVNTTKLKSRTLYTLPALTLHEAVPGHHLQIMLAAEIENLPKFRKSTYLSAFGEGWGLYSEWLGLEAGMYTDPYDNFGRLTYEMWRACRLVVDVGLHYKGWTRQQALDFMAENTALSMHEVRTEIDRYIGWPGQAVSYKMGELKIKELRQIAEAELKEDFDIRSFHDCLLANGSILLSSLEEEVHSYILEQKQ